MMASKARLFDDEKSLAQILEAADPKTAKIMPGGWFRRAT